MALEIHISHIILLRTDSVHLLYRVALYLQGGPRRVYIRKFVKKITIHIERLLSIVNEMKVVTL